MNSIYTSFTIARYSRLKLIWLGQKAIDARAMSPFGPEDTPTVGLSPKPTSQRGIYSRAITFILFEASFLVCAYYCLFHPIPLQSHPDDGLDILPSLNITLTELKAGVTAISVVWHALACLIVGDIIAVVRSAEFVAQHYRPGGLSPTTSDRVSKLTSGLVDNFVHFVKGTPTGAFRLALIEMLILMAVGPLGSSTLTIGTIMTTTKQQIQVTNLGSNMWNNILLEQRIPLIMCLEREENITFKYQMSSSLSSDPVLIPWPHLNTNLPEQGILTYQSDILHLHFQCAWMPTSSPLAGDLSPGIPYPVEGGPGDPSTNSYGTSISSYPRHTMLMELNCTVIIGLAAAIDFNATILFLTQQSPDILLQKYLTLSGLPFAFPISSDIEYTGGQERRITRTGAILSCHPGGSIMPAMVTLAGDTLTARRLPPSINGSMLIGNISPDAAQLTTLALQSSIRDYKPNADQMFLEVRRTTSAIRDGEELMVVEQEPLSVDEMAANIDLYMQSAMKAFLGGLIPAPDGMSTTLRAINQTAQITFPVVALVSSMPFLIVFTVVISLIMMLLGVLLWTIRCTELRLFDLENLTEMLGSK